MIPYVQFETNTNCNAHCIFCPHDKITPRPKMPDEMIEKIIKELAPNTASMLPFLYQEPLLEPRLLDILKTIKKINPDCNTAIYSNMALMTEQKARDLVGSQALNQIFISFYAPNEQLYRRFQGLDYTQTKGNIEKFIEIAKGKIRITMWYLDIPELRAHYQSFHSRWAPKVDQIGIVGYESYCGTIPGTQYFKLTRDPCNRPSIGMNILSDGKVVPCCLDYDGTVELGNIFEQNGMEIWNSQKMKKFRALHQNQQYDLLPKLC